MTRRDSFLLRVDPRVMESIRRWAKDELRSVNGHIEYLLRRSLAEAGRLDPQARGPSGDGETGGNG